MDYKSILLNTLLGLGLLALLTACGGPSEEVTIGSIKTSPEPLRIIGTPPDTLFYDSHFEFEFGAAGGDGEYRYRYIQNPVSNTGENINVAENPVEMTIEVLDSAKPLFKLKALPRLPDDINFQELNDRKYTYEIELTDGQNTVKRDFEFTLKKNKLQFIKLGVATEGVVNNTSAVTLLKQFNAGQTRICKQITERAFEKNTNNKGEVIYPFVFHVFVNAPVASRTELFYRISSNYSSSVAERADRNIGSARPGVDYINQERSITLEPGESVCVGFIEMLDDTLIEGNEDLRIEFFDRIGGAVDFESAVSPLTLRDNELLPKYESANIVRNRGDKVVVPIKTVIARNYPISVLVSVDQENTTADESDFILEPANGIVTINAGEQNASYTVTLLNKVDTNVASVFKDKLISIKTDIDGILDVEPYTIEINQWPLLNAIENEIIAYESDNEEVVSFTVDDDGIVTSLIAYDGDSDIKTRLKAFNRDASPFSMTNQNAVIELGKTDINIIPKAIGSISESDTHTLIVVANVNGLYADVFRGGVDFVVLSYKRNRGETFVLESARQYGTEGDDIVSNAIIRNNVLYVYGKTNGQNFENQPSNETNNGGEDGFIYAINSETNVYSWSRFIGTSDNDFVKDMDAGNRDIVALVSTTNTDQDAFVQKLSSRSGQNQEQAVEFKTPRDDIAVGIRFDSTANRYRALLNSSSLLSETNTQTPSLSQDAQLLVYDSENVPSGSFSISTADNDEAISLENIPDKKHFVVAGNTNGEFANNQKKSEIGRDTFVTIINSINTENKTIQFGTQEDDQVIAIRPVSNTKFLVLWKEEFTNTPTATYRISPFSIDGRKLSRDPGQ